MACAVCYACGQLYFNMPFHRARISQRHVREDGSFFHILPKGYLWRHGGVYGNSLSSSICIILNFVLRLESGPEISIYPNLEITKHITISYIGRNK